MRDSFNQIFSDVSRFLVVVAHPDDMDVSFGGTVARLIDEGKKVRVLVCTNGAMGSKQNDITQEKLIKVREKEQRAAGKILGLSKNDIFILDNEDCTLVDTDNDLIERIVYHMREFQPDIVGTHEPQAIFRKFFDHTYLVNHRDHRAVGTATINAVMPMSRDVSFFPQHKIDGLKSANVHKILITSMEAGEVGIEINKYIEKKKKALEMHASQFGDTTIDSIMQASDVNRENKNAEPSYFEGFKYYEVR